MFRNRRNSHKPNEELYAAFKQNFPGVHSTSNAPSTSGAPAQAGSMSAHVTESMANAMNAALDASAFGEQDQVRDSDLTPRGSMDPWRLTPSILDANTFSFAQFTNQAGYYTPTPGGMNTIYHNQAAGDLHTPGAAFQLGTPLSMPLHDSALNAGAAFDVSGFQSHMFQNPSFQNQSPFGQGQQAAAYPLSLLVHQDSGYAPVDGSPDNELDLTPSEQRDGQIPREPSLQIDDRMPAPPIPGFEKFRYHVTLNAPTAMIRSSNEIPVTYLNKGQAYTISIVDSKAAAPAPKPVKYRTVIRISFEDDQQRQRPSACWQLWKEGRGLAESHQRGGKLQAVEFVDPHPGAEEDPRRPRIELERTSFDCFSVTWTPSIATSTAECSVAVRFNFLSTDFSHSKGVKGIPVRLCAKTSALPQEEGQPETSTEPEVCFCKVKLFRDHGAERKLSNDVAHVKKTIEKLKQQIAQAESGVKEGSKRKRTASAAGKLGERPTKALKHKRTWSISSHGSGGRPAVEDDLHTRLSAMQDMFTSTRPVSVLYLKGQEQDDPDLFPVSLPKDRPGFGQTAQNADSWEKQSGELSPLDTSMLSPTSSTQSRGEQETNEKVARQYSADWPQSATLPLTNFDAALDRERKRTQVKIKRVSPGLDELDWVNVSGVDPAYVPPPQQLPKPVACVYVLLQEDEGDQASGFYRAIYLMQRNLSALISSIASKTTVDPSRVQRTVRINKAGLSIFVDDEVVRELPEGQDMKVEFKEIDTTPALKIEEQPGSTPINLQPLEMQIRF